LIELEALLITLLGCLLGAGLLMACLALLQGYLVAEYGIYIASNILTKNSGYLLISIIMASIVVAIIPSLNGYRKAREI
jgi:hypothetical protein